MICRIFELIVRIKPASAQGKLPLIAFDTICLSHCNHPLATTSILGFLKYGLANELPVVPARQCIDSVLQHMFHPYSPLRDKKICLEILGIMLCQGQYKGLKQADPKLHWGLLDELNDVKACRSNSSYRYDKRMNKKLLKLESFQLDLERSLNVSGKYESNTQTRLSELLEKSEDILYAYTLKQVIILLFTKMAAEEKDPLKSAIELAKYVVEYRVVDEEASAESRLTAENKEGIVTREKAKTAENTFRFRKSVIIGTKSFVIRLLEKLVHEEVREAELTSLLAQFANLLSLSFSFISIESNPHKTHAFRLARTAIKKCKGMKDVVPLNEEEEETEPRAGLEQFEAQTNTLVRQYMNKNSSYSTLNNVFSILYHFCKVPISRDANTLQKLMQQLVDPLKELVLTTTAEFSCEKHALECHFKRLKLLCKLWFIGAGLPRFDTHLQVGCGKEKAEEHASKFLRAADRKRIAALFTPEYKSE